MTKKDSELSVPAGFSDKESNRSMQTEVTAALANLSIVKSQDGFREKVGKYITEMHGVKTPPEKVRKRPDGFDYVDSSWMDHVAKEFIPFYKYELVHYSVEMGWINVIVSLTDRITGNVELGADSARIMVKRGTEVPSYKDIVDMGNNIKSALSKAIKNAQSRFGVAADVYQKRESAPTEEERKRFDEMSKTLYGISPSRTQIFKEQWANLGTDWSEFLDKWQVYVDRSTKQ